MPHNIQTLLQSSTARIRVAVEEGVKAGIERKLLNRRVGFVMGSLLVACTSYAITRARQLRRIERKLNKIETEVLT